MIRFYLGTHMPNWLATAGVPLFVSHRRLAGRRSLPRAAAPWALDSGGFSELSLFGGWRTTAEEYVADVRRYDLEIGRLDWAAPQDWMCEPIMLGKTGKTVDEHQLLTVRNFVRLQELWYGITADESPFMPVLQGMSEADYLRCADLYLEHGVDVRDYELVGIGSVCRRQATEEIGAILKAIKAHVDPDLPVHLFGVKTLGLRRYGDEATTADSLAWSFDGRYWSDKSNALNAREGGGQLCGTVHPRGAKNCANCLPYALAWRERVLDLPTSHYEPFGALAC